MTLASPYKTFLGIGAAAENSRDQRKFTYAALGLDQELLAIGEGDLAEVVAYACGQTGIRVAINAPRRPNLGLMGQESVRQKLVLLPQGKSWSGYRVAEYQLRQHHIAVLPTPDQKERCHPWAQAGFELYERLQAQGFKVFPTEDDLRQTLEVTTHGVFCALLGCVPFPRESLEGRLQRQLILAENGIKLPDPMDFFEEVTRFKLLHGILPLEHIHSPAELDALAAAYTAWVTVTTPKAITLLGDEQEGQIVLPVNPLKDSYSE